MIFHRITGRLSAALFAGTLLTAACSTADESQDTLEVSAVQQLTTKWAHAFSAAAPRGAAGTAEAAEAYLASVPAAQADQIAELLDNPGFTHAGIRQALIGADNQLGRYAEAIAQLDRLVTDAPATIPASSVAFLRALNTVGIDARVGVVVPDDDKRRALIAELIAQQPAKADGWSEMYAYQLGTALFVEGRTDDALAQFLPLIDSNLELSGTSGRLDAETVGSALNMSVTSLKARGDLDRAKVYLDRTIELDDTYHLNFAGRFGQNTNPRESH